MIAFSYFPNFIVKNLRLSVVIFYSLKIHFAKSGKSWRKQWLARVCVCARARTHARVCKSIILKFKLANVFLWFINVICNFSQVKWLWFIDIILHHSLKLICFSISTVQMGFPDPRLMHLVGRALHSLGIQIDWENQSSPRSFLALYSSVRILHGFVPKSLKPWNPVNV